MAAFLVADTVAAYSLQLLTGQWVPTPLLETEHVLLLTALGWLAWRRRSVWTVGILLAQVGVVATDVAHLFPIGSSILRRLTIANVLANIQLVLLLLCVIRNRLGPPFPIPGPMQAMGEEPVRP